MELVVRRISTDLRALSDKAVPLNKQMTGESSQFSAAAGQESAELSPK